MFRLLAMGTLGACGQYSVFAEAHCECLYCSWDTSLHLTSGGI